MLGINFGVKIFILILSIFCRVSSKIKGAQAKSLLHKIKKIIYTYKAACVLVRAYVTSSVPQQFCTEKVPYGKHFVQKHFMLLVVRMYVPLQV